MGSRKGYRCSFTFEPLKCGKCNHILREPHTTDCCKRNYCQNCIIRARVCPTCGSDTFEHHANMEIGELLSKFVVDCTNRCDSKWTGPLKEHDLHLNVDPLDTEWLKGCKKTRVTCIYCRNRVEQRAVLLKRIQKIFQPSDLDRVYELTKEVSKKWQDVGLGLEFQPTEIESIQESCKGRCKDKKIPEDVFCRRCYHDLLKEWIQSTKGAANWEELIRVFEEEKAVAFEELSRRLKKVILCSDASERVEAEIQRAITSKKNYEQHAKKVQSLKAELKTKRSFIDKKKEELRKLKLSCQKPQQQLASDMSKFTAKLETSEDTIASIAKEITEYEQSELELIEQIGEAENQLKDAKDSMDECLISLQNEVKDLKYQKEYEIQERGLGESQSTQNNDQDIRAGAGAGAVAGTILGLAVAATEASAGVGALVAGSAVLGPFGLVGGLLVGGVITALVKDLSDKEKKKKEVEEKYARLIQRCIDAINDIKPAINKCEKQLKILKTIVEEQDQ